MKNEKYLGNLIAIKEHYNIWHSIKGDTTHQDGLLKRKRGYELEKIIYSILYNEQLKPRTGFEPEGEQIDGSFLYEKFPFLLEAKWHVKPTEASKIYAFKGKVDGKFHLTSGVFISMSDYSNEAEEALRFGKTANVIMFNKQDIEDIILKGNTFIEVLEYKIEQAAFYGLLYAPFSTKETIMKSEKTLKSISTTKTKSSSKIKKQILVISPKPEIIPLFVKNTIDKLSLPTNLDFFQMAYVSSDPKAATLKNIHRILFSLEEFSSYSGIIILYPSNNEMYKPDTGEFFELNKLLTEAGLKNGAMAVHTMNGDLNETIRLTIQGYLNQV